MAQCPHLSLHNELLQISLIVFRNHLVVILQVTFFDKSFVTNVYKAYNLPILHPMLKKTVQYSVKGEYLAHSCNSCYVTISSEHDVLICLFTKEHMCQIQPCISLRKYLGAHTPCL